MEEKQVVPQGFILEPITGIYYKCQKRQMDDGKYVNEITWLNSKTGKKVVTDYSMSQQQIDSMSYQEKYALNNAGQIYVNTDGQLDTYQHKSSRKVVIALGSLATVLVVGLGICAWKFGWIPLGKKETPKDSGNVAANQESELDLTLPDSFSNGLAVNRPQDDLVDEGEGYSFTELDEEYFYPTSGNYMIIKHVNVKNSIIELFSYDDDANCIQHRVRIEYKNVIKKENYGKIKKAFNKAFEAEDYHFEGNVVYFEEAAERAMYTQDSIVSLEEQGVFTILANKRGDESFAKDDTQEGYTFTEDDQTYFKPYTEHYEIIRLQDRSYVLLSFNDSGVCIKYRLRMDLIIQPTPEQEQAIRSQLIEMEASNISVVNGVLYADMKIEAMATRDSIRYETKTGGYEVLVEK